MISLEITHNNITMKSLTVKVTALVLAFVLFFSVMPSLNALAADEGPGQYRVSVSSTLRLRSGPGTNYSSLALIPNGTVLKVTETSKGWGKTVYQTKAGWISLDYAHRFADNDGNTASKDQINDIIKTAKGELGYKEGRNNYTKYGVWYSSATKNAPWCAIFVCWCAYQVGISESIIPRFSFCYNGITLFKNLNVWHDREGYTPKTGDIIFFRSDEAKSASDHVGIVVSVDSEKVYTIEGNSSDAVSERTYDLTDKHIVGYAAPKYIPGPVTSPSDTTTSTSTTTTSTTSSTTNSSATQTETSASSTQTTQTTSSATSATTEPTTAPTQPVFNEVLTVTASVVNLRSEAKISSNRIAMIKKGDSFTKFEEKKDSNGETWYKITVDGQTGYILGKYASVIKEADSKNTSATGEHIVITGSVVNVRGGAGQNNSKLGSVTKNSILKKLDSTTVSGVTWYKVDYNGESGYISGEYSKLVSEITIDGAVVNVRSQPGSDSNVIARVRNGESFTICGSADDSDGVLWIKININGEYGYINGNFITLK